MQIILFNRLIGIFNNSNMAILVHKRVSPLEPIFEIRLNSAVISELHYVRDILHAPMNTASTRVQRKDARSRICEPRVQIVTRNIINILLIFYAEIRVGFYRLN